MDQPPFQTRPPFDPRLLGGFDADDPADDAGQMVVTPAPAPTPVRTLPQWRVLLHNDDVNDMLYVVLAIRRLTALDEPTAVECMLEAHQAGVTILLVTHREHAELLAEQFESLGLIVTIEPDR